MNFLIFDKLKTLGTTKCKTIKLKIKLLLNIKDKLTTIMMLFACEDTTLKISEFLTDHEKIQLIATSKIFDNLKHKFAYREMIKISKICRLSYFDNFEHVRVSKEPSKYPKKLKHIYFKFKARAPIGYKNVYEIIPQSVTHLTLGHQLIQLRAPSVTHLHVYACLNPITTRNLQSVTHLRFSYYFDSALYKYSIPSSVTHLEFGYQFNQPIKNFIPSSVTHLKFGCRFNQPIEKNNIPSVTHLKFGDHFNQIFDDDILRSITEIILSKTYPYEINKNIASKIIIRQFLINELLIKKLIFA